MIPLSPAAAPRGDSRNATAKSMQRIAPFAARLIGLALACAAAGRGAAESLPNAEPYDIVVLKTGGDEGRLEVYPIELPARRVPNPPPAGAFTARTLDNPGEPLSINWAAVERIEFFEQRLLNEAARLTRRREFPLAFDHLARLDRDYPTWPGLDGAFASYLRADALARFRDRDYDHALAILHSLYDRSPDARGVRQAVDAVGGEILKAAWEANDFRAVGATLAALRDRFPKLDLKTVPSWEKRLDERAAAAIERAERALAEGDFRQARVAANEAIGLTPGAEAPTALLERIERRNPTVRIAVIQSGEGAPSVRLDTPIARRLSRLTGGVLARLDDYAPTGGVYSSALGEVLSDDSKRAVRLRLTPEAADGGRGTYLVARALLHAAEERTPELHALAERAAQVAVERPNEITVALSRPHARPEALLKGPMPESLLELAPQSWKVADASDERVVYQRVAEGRGFQVLEETRYASEQAAVDALLRGDVHVLANLPPWRVVAMRRARGVSIGEYRLPTLHCLLMSAETPLRRSREARRALCYGLSRERFVKDVLLGGEPAPGFQTLSAALPAGRSLGDPLRYGYNDGLVPRPFQPRLAALLSALGRRQLAKEAEESADNESGETAAAGDPPPLVLLHPPTPVARLACRSIEAQLDALGVEVKRVEAAEREIATDPIPHDLRYAEVRVGEPMVDAWRLFGPEGLAGDCSATLLAALEQLDRATNGKEVGDALQEAHEVLAGDLPMAPLWQTVDYYAFRTDLAGLPQETVDLYQTLNAWRYETRGGRR